MEVLVSDSGLFWHIQQYLDIVPLMHICFVVVHRLQKKNEEAFIRAIDIAKQQFGHACGAWLDRVNKLLPQSQQIRVKKVRCLYSS